MEAKREIRFKLNEFSYAKIDTNTEGVFAPKVAGLLLNESLNGYALAITASNQFEVDSWCRVQINNYPILISQVKWIKKVDKEVYKIGFEILE